MCGNIAYSIHSFSQILYLYSYFFVNVRTMFTVLITLITVQTTMLCMPFSLLWSCIWTVSVCSWTLKKCDCKCCIAPRDQAHQNLYILYCLWCTFSFSICHKVKSAVPCLLCTSVHSTSSMLLHTMIILILILNTEYQY